MLRRCAASQYSADKQFMPSVSGVLEEVRGCSALAEPALLRTFPRWWPLFSWLLVNRSPSSGGSVCTSHRAGEFTSSSRLLAICFGPLAGAYLIR